MLTDTSAMPHMQQRLYTQWSEPKCIYYTQDITTPLIQKGILKERSEAELEKDLKHFVVVLRDEAFVGCAMLKMYDSKYAEISCLAVHPKFRMQGIGEVRLIFYLWFTVAIHFMLSEIYTTTIPQSLLGCLERRAFASGLEYCFILSTVTMTWFAERGYEELPLEELPSVHQHLYNWKRNPKVNLSLVYFIIYCISWVHCFPK